MSEKCVSSLFFPYFHKPSHDNGSVEVDVLAHTKRLFGPISGTKEEDLSVYCGTMPI